MGISSIHRYAVSCLQSFCLSSPRMCRHARSYISIGLYLHLLCLSCTGNMYACMIYQLTFLFHQTKLFFTGKIVTQLFYFRSVFERVHFSLWCMCVCVCVCARVHARMCVLQTGRGDEIARSSTNKFTNKFTMQAYCRWVYWTDSFFFGLLFACVTDWRRWWAGKEFHKKICFLHARAGLQGMCVFFCSRTQWVYPWVYPRTQCVLVCVQDSLWIKGHTSGYVRVFLFILCMHAGMYVIWLLTLSPCVCVEQACSCVCMFAFIICLFINQSIGLSVYLLICLCTHVCV